MKMILKNSVNDTEKMGQEAKERYRREYWILKVKKRRREGIEIILKIKENEKV